MTTLSLCMIVKNESDVLARCIRSARAACDEIIIVDTGSTDDTKKIARELGARVYDYAWQDDFAAARNYSFSKATCDYIMWLDADDVILPEDLEMLLRVKQNVLDGKVRQAVARYDVGFDENGKPNFFFYRERILLRAAAFKWIGEVHETIPIEKDAVTVSFAVTHKKLKVNEPGRNLRIYENLKSRGKVFSPRENYYYARELFFNGRKRECADLLEDFLKSDGSASDKISACIMLSDCRGGDISALTKSFEYGLPDPEVCCKIADIYFRRKDYSSAVYWYERATEGAFHGFSNAEYKGYIPYIQMCVCYDKLGFTEKAIDCNERAAAFKQTPAVEHNRKYFNNLKR